MMRYIWVLRLRAIPIKCWKKLKMYLPWRMRIAIGSISTLQFIGTIGYPLIEGEPWTFFDGFYMTAITLATIGYDELYPLSNPGRLFTVVLSYLGIFTLAYFASEILRMVIGGELAELLGRQRMEAQLAQMKDHLIICGHGRMGKIVCDQLDRQKRQYVVIDINPPPPDWNYTHGLWVQGNATEDEVLRRAGLERAKALISVVASDADNLYITLSSRLINSKVTIVARAEEQEADAKLRKVGASYVISPYLAGGNRAVQAVLRPGVLQFMEMTTRPEFHDLQIEELRIPASSQLANRTIRETHLVQDMGIIVVSIVRPNGEVLYAPQGDVVIEADAMLILLGHRKQLDKVEYMAAQG